MIIFAHSIWLHHDAKCLHDKVKQNDLNEIYLFIIIVLPSRSCFCHVSLQSDI